MNLLQQANVSLQWKNKTLGNFDREREPEAYDVAEKYVEKWQACREKGIGLFLQSRIPGVGKTHLAWAVLVKIIQRYPHQISSPYSDKVIEENISSQRWDVNYYLERLQASYHSHNGIVSQAPDIDLLILDDLGKEYECDWSRTNLRTLFNTRYEKELPTILTTTISIFTLCSRLGADVMDRILSRSRVVEFQSKESYRKLESREILKEIGL